jgi:hypothetical protein
MAMAMPIVAATTRTFASLSDAVRVAVSVQRQIAALTEELDAAKCYIRVAARARGLSEHNTPVHIETSAGTCPVSHVPDKLTVIGDVDVVRSSLPAKLANRIFAQKTVLSSVADDIVLALPHAQRAHLSGKVEFRCQTARVLLPR